ncbi:DoxX family protein [Amycolatopsis sp. FDAARGOS 1241]|uniref:DoxX family protein n=1 Tax=Amycolatopsis sp. FDAARGOS 1241 TaxID=2778070 RepID=UPI00194F66B3|nr:DoxX family protein [Amycolatopsis sp. FDAARGOS 1241]QRP42856.1 DoxX family protein [Amycolatopsis sp. FDAARGOS 1241]
MSVDGYASLVLRLTIGVIMAAHGYNHLWGPGGVGGTARWFAGIGLRPARVHAMTSGVLELAAGLGLLVGFATPLCVAAVVGVSTVAGVAVHRKNGFFVFRDGYEYVLALAFATLALALLGPGAVSLDHVLGLRFTGWWGAGAALLGVVGAGALLAVAWRPNAPEEPSRSDAAAPAEQESR